MIFYFKYFGLFVLGFLIQYESHYLMDSAPRTSLALRLVAALIALGMFAWLLLEWRRGGRSKVRLVILAIPAVLLGFFCGAVV